MTSASEDPLTTSEGVDEGSADSTAEGASSTEGRAGPTGASAGPESEGTPAPPVDTDVGGPAGPGQQLAAGEG